jgi:hypothetical protein
VPAPDDDVPRLPRGRGLKLDTAMILRIAMTVALLVMIIVTARPCANATSKFVTGFDEQGSASSALPKPGTVDEPVPEPASADYETLDPNMSEAELKAAIERAKQKAAGNGAVNPDVPTGAVDGSAGHR